MLQNEIDQKLKVKNDLVIKLEEQKQLYLKELTPFVTNWYKEEMKRTVKDNADKITSIGEEKAKQLKEETQELISKTDDLVQKHIGVDSIWWHTNNKKLEKYFSEREVLEPVETNIRKLFGELGAILYKYDIVRPKSEYSSDYGNSWKESNRQIKYAYGIVYSDKLVQISKEYIKLTTTCNELIEEIIELKDRQKKENIEEWWESL
ncbi:hypothetical protein [Halobacillus sp. A5]|uniref:hypothetical protein n=1 Tax=Halobacillus sp. A5 TaxID=2880263 RepID=UPI0020A6592A|nr:hypothetical protein [Halobacillus sp. A5]MCP3026012.1 hypothetical protein [Halobacillus sp. A5]